MTTQRSTKARRNGGHRSARMLLLALCTSMATIGCSESGGTGPDTNGPILLRANASGGKVITVTSTRIWIRPWSPDARIVGAVRLPALRRNWPGLASDSPNRPTVASWADQFIRQHVP